MTSRLARRRLQRRTFVLLTRRIDARNGVCTSVVNLANALATAGLDVTVLVLFRAGDLRDLDPRVRLSYLRDRRPQAEDRLPPKGRALLARPTSLSEQGRGMNALTDRRLRVALRRLGPCTLVTHRPVLHEAAARWAPSHVVTLAVEHTPFKQRSPEEIELVSQCLPGLDRLVVLTEEDEGRWRDHLSAGPGLRHKVVRIPNTVPVTADPRSSWDAPVIIAAGNLIPRKGFDRLIRSFASLASSFPEWEVHIHGQGPEQDALQRLIESEGLGDRVHLRGYCRDLAREMSGASIFVMSSHSEALPMVLLEAMQSSLPVVAFDCTGVRELVHHDVTGLLVPADDLEGMSEGLRTLMISGELRARQGRAGRDHAQSYGPDAVSERWRDVVRTTTARPFST